MTLPRTAAVYANELILSGEWYHDVRKVRVTDEKLTVRDTVPDNIY